jgi:hypothetical protein
MKIRRKPTKPEQRRKNKETLKKPELFLNRPGPQLAPVCDAQDIARSER